MTDLVHASNASTALTPSYDLRMIAVYACIAVALFIVAVLYSDPSNLVPADPVLSSFYP